MRFVALSLLAFGTLLGQSLPEPGPVERALPVLSARAEAPLPFTEGAAAVLTPGMPSGVVNVVNNAIPMPVVQPMPKPLRPRTTTWKLSLLALTAAHTADAVTSWNKRELNPVLSAPGSAFGWQSVAIKMAFAGASVSIQAVLLHRHPEFAKRFAALNFVQVGVIGGVAVHNSMVPAR